MIAPVCDWCKRELTAFGGLLFTPPDDGGKVRKLHVCVACLPSLMPAAARSEG